MKVKQMEKKLKCPMCDSSNLKEENGYYVCQICGNKIPAISQSDNKPKKLKKHKTTKDATIIKVVSLLIVLSIFLREFIAIILSSDSFEYFNSYDIVVYIFEILFCLALIAFIVFSVLEWRGKVVPFVAKTCIFVLCGLSLFIPAIISRIAYQVFNNLLSSCTTLLTLYLLEYQCPKWINHGSN